MTENTSFGRKDISSLLSPEVFAINRPIASKKQTQNETKETTQKPKSKRLYRPTSATTKMRNYHLLAMMNDEEENEDEEEEEEEDFIRKRVKTEAVIIQKKDLKNELVIKSKRFDDSDRERSMGIVLEKANDIKVKEDDEKHLSSDDSDDSTSSSEESSSESSSSSEDIVHTNKPKFIPKSKRDKITTSEEQEAKHQLEQEAKLAQQKKRTLESRALVAQVISLENDKKQKLSKEKELTNEEDYGGASNVKPDDNDEDKGAQYEKWTVRELLRILSLYDDEIRKQREQEEYIKRKAMTDEEIMQLQQSKQIQDDEDSSKPKYSAQRYYHRGAYYMDEDTLSNKNDVRNKAKEYAQQATRDDIMIADAIQMNLPKIKQNKYFGFSGHSTKYKGLAKEDTTDKKLKFIPHASSNPKNK